MADAPVAGHLRIADAFRLRAIEVRWNGTPASIAALTNRWVSGKNGPVVLDRHFAVASAIRVIAADAPFDFPEVGQHIV